MSDEARERRWIKQHRSDPAVRAWLRDHPPPAEWEGSPMQWAFTERPDASRVLPALAVAAGLFGVVWLVNRIAPASPPPAR